MECMYVQQLPFAENLRQYQFAPLSPDNPATKKAFLPSQVSLAYIIQVTLP